MCVYFLKYCDTIYKAMEEFYQTAGGHYYRVNYDGSKRRVSGMEYAQAGGATAKKSAKRAEQRVYTGFEKECFDKAEVIVKKFKDQHKGEIEKMPKKERGKFIAGLVAKGYLKAMVDHAECKDFYTREKELKDKLKAERRASRKSRRKSRRKSSKKSKKTSPKKK